MEDLSPEQIAQWKVQYGSIYSTPVRNVNYVFRAITLKQFQDAFKDTTASAADREETIIRIALIHPLEIDFDGISPGVVSALAEEILEVSGFQNPKLAREKLEARRKEYTDVFILMKAMILATMPTTDVDLLDELTFDQLLNKVVLAEKIIEVHQAIMGGEPVKLVLVDPEAEEAEQTFKHAAQKKPGTAGYNDPIAERLKQAFG